jgi:L-ascorbate metabolism protein UlaG (beta-lactamase superfamily)
MDIRFLGHACFSLEHDGTTVLVDPFLTGNPKAAAQAADVAADVILLTHGHADHIGDTVDIAKRTDAPVVAMSGSSTRTSAGRSSSTGAPCG